MANRYQPASLSTLDIQTLQPRLRVHGPVVLLILFGSFPLFFYLEHGPNKIFHCALSVLAGCAVLFHFSKEYRLVHDRLTAIATVTYYGLAYKGSSRILRAMMRRFSPGVPVIEYSFVAFNQKTYTGKTGFRVGGFYEGAKVTILYKPGKPSVNHPATSFIFYQFR